MFSNGIYCKGAKLSFVVTQGYLNSRVFVRPRFWMSMRSHINSKFSSSFTLLQTHFDAYAAGDFLKQAYLLMKLLFKGICSFLFFKMFCNIVCCRCVVCDNQLKENSPGLAKIKLSGGMHNLPNKKQCFINHPKTL